MALRRHRAPVTVTQHAVAQVYTADLSMGETIQGASSERAGTTAEVEDAPVRWSESVEEHLVGGAKEEPLQRVAIVVEAPAIKLVFGISGLVGHPWFSWFTVLAEFMPYPA